MMEKKLFNLKSRLKSFVYAFRGLRRVVREPNAIVHGFFAILTIIAGFIFELSVNEWLAIVICCGLVISAEIFNTAIEVFVDMVSPYYNRVAGEIKDLASAATFICAVTAAIVGLIIFLPKCLLLLNR